MDDYISAGNENPLVATIEKVYRKDENGRKLTEAIKSRMEELQQERSEVGSSGSNFTQEEEIEIIAEAKGKKKGTCILGTSVRRPPLPRGGVTAAFKVYEEIQKELDKVNEDRKREHEEADAFRQEMMANFKKL